MTASSATASRPYLLRPCEAAKFLSVSESTIRRFVAKDMLPVCRLGDERRSAIAFRVSDLIKFADSRVEKVKM